MLCYVMLCDVMLAVFFFRNVRAEEATRVRARKLPAMWNEARWED